MGNALAVMKEERTAGHGGRFKPCGVRGASSASSPRRPNLNQKVAPGGFPSIWLNSYLTFVTRGEYPPRGRDVCVPLSVPPVRAMPNILSIFPMRECGGKLRLFSCVATANITPLGMLSVY